MINTHNRPHTGHPRKEHDYREKIRRHRLNGAAAVFAVLLFLAVIITILIVQYRRHVYTSYDTITSYVREAVSGSVDVCLGDTVMTYSKDGVHCTDTKGNVLWNQTYEIQDILVDVNRDVAVIASYNGRDVYVLSSEEILGKFTTNLPIRNVAVSASGRVAVFMEGTNEVCYTIYSAQGESLFEGQVTMTGSGYPLSASLSPDGELMQISYIYLDSGIQKTNLVFYNLGPVGENSTDYMVSVYEYKDVLIPYTEFMDNDTAFAVGDNMLMIYQGARKPVLQTQFLYDDKVRSVFYNEDYIGLVYYSETGGALYTMNVYSSQGEQIGTYGLDIEYTDIVFSDKTFIVYNDEECVIKTLDNEEKYRGGFSGSIRRILPLKSPYKLFVVTKDSMDAISLR